MAEVSDGVPELGALFEAGRQYERDVQAAFLAIADGDVSNPKWTQWCAEMDAWRAAVAEAADGGEDS